MSILKNNVNISVSTRELTNFILFTLGKSVSLFGTFTYTFVVGLYVLRLTGSGLSFATTLLFSTLPIIIINPISGVLADSLNKKMLIILMDFLNGLVMLGLYFLSSIYGFNLTMTYTSIFIMTSFMTILDTSFTAATPNIVSDKNLIIINSISKIVGSISTILGPVVGGVLFVFVDIKLFMIFNGVSFIFSGISEIFIDFNFNCKKLKDGNKRTITFISDLNQGFGYLLEKPKIIKAFITLIFVNFSIGLSISIPLPFIINYILNLSSKSFGIIQGALPVGLIIGAIFVTKTSRKLTYNKILKATNFALAICIIMLCIPVLPFNITINKTVLLIYYCLVMSIVGLSISFIDIPLISFLQSSISDEYRGRVISLGMSMVKIISPIAFVLSGIFIDIFPVYLLHLMGSIILIISNEMLLKKRNKAQFNFKSAFMNLAKGSTFYIIIELTLFILIRNKDIEAYFFIWLLISLFMLIANIQNVKSNISSDYLIFVNDVLDRAVLKKENIILKKQRVQGGIFNERNLVYVFGFILNFIIYINHFIRIIIVY